MGLLRGSPHEWGSKWKRQIDHEIEARILQEMQGTFKGVCKGYIRVMLGIQGLEFPKVKLPFSRSQ